MIAIRHAIPDDAEAIARILNAIIEARVYTALDTPLTVEQERAFIERVPARGVFHVAVDTSDGGVVGFQTVEPFATYTRAFDHVGVIGTFVDLDRRRHGIASQLFDRTFSPAPVNGYEKCSPSSARTTRLPSRPTYGRGWWSLERHDSTPESTGDTSTK